MRTRALWIALLVLAACGASAQQKALHATYIGVKAAEVGFVEWDKRHQDELVARAPSLPEGIELLNDYRMQREPVLQAFAVAYKLLYLAATDTTDDHINAAIGAAKVVYELLETIRKPPPPPATTVLDRPREGVARVQSPSEVSEVWAVITYWIAP